MTTIADAFDLTGRVALVTGAGRGLGRAISARLAEAGATVVCADIDHATATETASTIRADGHRAAPVHLDVTRRADVEALVDQIVADQGHLDVMVNNAAIIADGLVLDTTEEELDRVLAVNFKGVFFGCQAAGRVMSQQGSGSIINLASGAIDMPTPSLVCYSTAKAAVAQLSRTLAMELAPQRVRVNAIAPGWIDTPMNERHARRADGTPRRGAAGCVPRAAGEALADEHGRRARRHRVRGAVPGVAGGEVRHRHRHATERWLDHAVVSDEPPAPARVTGPITGDRPPAGAPDVDLAARGYVLEEFAIEGTARAFHLLDDPTPDGRWSVAEYARAPYRTRLLVLRPGAAGRRQRHGGRRLAERVRRLRERCADATARSTRGTRGSGVSAQEVGLYGFPAGMERMASRRALPLLEHDPERYGDLHHPGDQAAFDIFTQAGRALVPDRARVTTTSIPSAGSRCSG